MSSIIEERINNLLKIKKNPIISKPKRIISLIDNSYKEEKKGVFFNEDLFILIYKWMQSNLFILNPIDLYNIGFKHKKNSYKELIKTITPNEAMVVNYISGEITSWEKSTGYYHYLTNVNSIEEFNTFFYEYEKKANL